MDWSSTGTSCEWCNRPHPPALGPHTPHTTAHTTPHAHHAYQPIPTIPSPLTPAHPPPAPTPPQPLLHSRPAHPSARTAHPSPGASTAARHCSNGTNSSLARARCTRRVTPTDATAAVWRQQTGAPAPLLTLLRAAPARIMHGHTCAKRTHPQHTAGGESMHASQAHMHECLECRVHDAYSHAERPGTAIHSGVRWRRHGAPSHFSPHRPPPHPPPIPSLYPGHHCVLPPQEAAQKPPDTLRDYRKNIGHPASAACCECRRAWLQQDTHAPGVRRGRHPASVPLTPAEPSPMRTQA